MYSHLCSSQWPHEVADGATAPISLPSEPMGYSDGLVRETLGTHRQGVSLKGRCRKEHPRKVAVPETGLLCQVGLSHIDLLLELHKNVSNVLISHKSTLQLSCKVMRSSVGTSTWCLF